MSIAEKENELKPCHCGSEDVQSVGYATNHGIRFGVGCNHCQTHLNGFATKAEAIAAWNRSFVPAAQWNKEPPTEPWMYWITYTFRGEAKKGLAEISECGGELDITITRQGKIVEYMPLKLFCKYRTDIQWYSIPEPPLPAKEETK